MEISGELGSECGNIQEGRADSGNFHSRTLEFPVTRFLLKIPTGVGAVLPKKVWRVCDCEGGSGSARGSDSGRGPLRASVASLTTAAGRA